MEPLSRLKIAVLDDYQAEARNMADWRAVEARADVVFFHDNVRAEDALVARLESFDAVCVMRERTPLAEGILRRLPRLRMIASTAPRNASIDPIAGSLGIEVMHTGYFSTPTAELTLALLFACARNIPLEHNNVQTGGWQTTIGADLNGATLGILGLGNIGREIARVGLAVGMKVIAWSENLNAEDATAQSVEAVSRDELFSRADFLSVHVQLSDRTRGLVGRRELELMKRGSRLVNTSRSAIVDMDALWDALESGQLAAAAVDVYDDEPLPHGDRLRAAPGTLITTPHIGYVTRALLERFYGDTVTNLLTWLDGRAH
ncbi:Lactate dehydrogenase [Luteibacter sp. UNCMF331Sha3.1]|uniref:D-2-hydroxyacid dehydrogenase family protein n=1 Tax=Luteibacter sp. UNCMF331Sha3.1 TaxID=1502760 RepID=UPI0008CC5B5E|nr:D-2-hydroxyacid dehydrogenase family protein [Luteibacter sp. UNCMF331Sha3.1]SEN11529.1 Lactate dehydrogenase [Luteibacter sp. UNCMF331Sha3.1]